MVTAYGKIDGHGQRWPFKGFVFRMDFCEKASWFLANITNGICPVVSVFYWTFMFPQLDVAMKFDITFLHLFNMLWYEKLFVKIFYHFHC